MIRFISAIIILLSLNTVYVFNFKPLQFSIRIHLVRTVDVWNPDTGTAFGLRTLTSSKCLKSSMYCFLNNENILNERNVRLHESCPKTELKSIQISGQFSFGTSLFQKSTVLNFQVFAIQWTSEIQTFRFRPFNVLVWLWTCLDFRRSVDRLNQSNVPICFDFGLYSTYNQTIERPKGPNPKRLKSELNFVRFSKPVLGFRTSTV